MDLDVQNHVRALVRAREHYRVGPFLVRHNAGWPSPAANYAIPDEGAEPTAADVRALVAAFRERDRRPRLEYLPSTAPRVEPVLLAAGFTVESKAPVMACRPGELVEPAPVVGLSVAEPVQEVDYLRVAEVQHAAYREPGTVTPGEVAWVRTAHKHGGAVALATYGSPAEDVGAAVCGAPAEGLTELAGLAVAEDFRRRGIGAAVTAYLTRRMLADDACRAVWLEPADGDVQRVYARLGYRAVGEKLSVSLD